MGKTLTTETQVKKALKVDSFDNLPDSKVQELIKILPNIDTDVICSIFNNLPSYCELARKIIEKFKETSDRIIETNASSHMEVMKTYRKMIDNLGEVLKREDITQEERTSIIKDIKEIANRMAEIDAENRAFYSKIVEIGGNVLVGVIALGGIILGAYAGACAYENITKTKES